MRVINMKIILVINSVSTSVQQRLRNYFISLTEVAPIKFDNVKKAHN